MLNTTEEFLKLRFLKRWGKKRVGLRFERGCGSQYEAFFRENSAFSVYEFLTIKAESSWLCCGVLRQNFHPGWKVRAIKPVKSCHGFLEDNSKS